MDSRPRLVPARSLRRACHLLAAWMLLGSTACVTLMSPEREAAIGRQEAAKVEQQIGLVRTPALVTYVEQIGARVAQQSPRRDVTYRFFVADMEEPNAFALPGGYIYVSRGLLALTNSEDELAGVIGHEIGHVAERHAAERQSRAMGAGLLAVIGVIAGTALGGAEMGQLAGQVGQIAGAGLIASYSRGQEREADDVGQAMAARAGYSARGITDFLRTLGRETELRLGQQRRPSFLDSHPATEERVRATSDRAAALTAAPVPPFSSTREAYVARLEGILVGPDPAGGVFDGQQFLHPGLGLKLTFPAGWKTVNQATAVAGQAPDQRGLILLEPDGPSGDPAVAASRYFEQSQVRPRESGRIRVGPFDAFRVLADVSTNAGPAIAEWVWIAHPSGVFRITTLASADVADRRRPEIRATVRSFGQLTAEDRARIRERRLEIVRARPGETLAQLSSRSGNAWTLEETAVANGLVASDRLQGGYPVKIARERPYRP